MRKRICIFAIFYLMTATANAAATRDAKLTNTTGYNYNYMYPYMNNQMRTDLNPGVTTSQSLSPINAVVRTIPLGEKRRVVARPTTARAATNAPTARRRVSPRPTTAARSGIIGGTGTNAARIGIRRGVVARTSRPDNTTPNRDEQSYAANRAPNTATIGNDTARMSSGQCLAQYTECMNQYCERPETAYNRCFCSSKLAQIDSQYQQTIDNLMTKLSSLQNSAQWSDAEMNEYWMDRVGKHTGDNSWTNLENALNIDWASMENRTRGQNAFVTGHEYCSRYLRECYYMATNLRDAYRSQISRDCDAYEYSLQKIKTAAESIIEANK